MTAGSSASRRPAATLSSRESSSYSPRTVDLRPGRDVALVVAVAAADCCDECVAVASAGIECADDWHVPQALHDGRVRRRVERRVLHVDERGHGRHHDGHPLERKQRHGVALLRVGRVLHDGGRQRLVPERDRLVVRGAVGRRRQHGELVQPGRDVVVALGVAFVDPTV